MLRDTRISFIGGGNMAEAIIRGLLTKELIEPAHLLASDALPDRLAFLNNTYQVKTTTDNHQAAQSADIVVLSVKPQVLPHVLQQIDGAVPPEAFVLSIVAGVSITQISDGLHHPSIVRVMPNTPAMVGKGMSVWTATPQVSEAQEGQVRAILQALGEEVQVQDEHHVDMATALNGSGPAYVFLFIEALIDAGVHLGFSRPVAEKIVLQTVEGSAVLARQMGLHPAELRNRVTSPAGTTAEALYELEQGALRATLARAVWAAYNKTRDLGGHKGQ